MSHIFGQNIDLNKNEALKFRLENLLSAPSLTVGDAGYIYHNTASNGFFGWNGTAWVDLGASGAGTYTLPTASTVLLGGVKIDGTTITIAAGIISATPSGIAPTGLQKIGGGWRLIGRTSGNYAGLGIEAIDFSYKSLWTSLGATGYGSFAQGEDIKARNFGSIAMGALIDNNDISGFATGINHVTAGYVNTVFGVGQRITGMGCMAVGQAAEIVSSGTNDWNNYPTKTMFVVGNGTIQNGSSSFTVLTRKNAFKVLYNGEVTAPSLTIALTSAETTGKVLITREYLRRGYTVATLPTGVVGDRAYVTDATTPTYNGTLTGGGAITVPVFYNGTIWVSA
jgi:hypothetical protein